MTTVSLFRMERQRKAKKQRQERRTLVANIHKTSLSVSNNISITQNIQINQNISTRSNIATSPIPQNCQRNIPKKYPLLQEVFNNAIRNPKGRRWSIGFLIFSSLIYFYSPTAYSIFKENMPLPAISTLYKELTSEILDKSELLLDASKLPEILEIYEKKL